MQTCICPSWCHCHSLPFASVKSRLVLPFWYRLTRVVPEKGPLNGCVCVSNPETLLTTSTKSLYMWLFSPTSSRDTESERGRASLLLVLRMEHHYCLFCAWSITTACSAHGASLLLVLRMPVSLLCYFFDHFFKIPNRGRFGELALDDGREPSACGNINKTHNHTLHTKTILNCRNKMYTSK